MSKRSKRKKRKKGKERIGGGSGKGGEGSACGRGRSSKGIEKEEYTVLTRKIKPSECNVCSHKLGEKNPPTQTLES